MEKFEEKYTYLLFIRNGDWYSTPFTNWFHSVFKEIEFNGKSLLVDSENRVLEGFDENGARVYKPKNEASIKKSVALEELKSKLKTKAKKLAQNIKTKPTKYPSRAQQ